MDELAISGTASGCLLGEGRVAEVREHGDLVLKLYRSGASPVDAFREASILAAIARCGLPAPQVRAAGDYGGRWGLLMTRAPGRPFAEAMRELPETVPRYLEAMAALQVRIHACRVDGLEVLKPRLANRICRAAGLGEVRRRRLLDLLAALPDGDRLCHGDFHPNNILGEPGSGRIVDWLDAAVGHPAADLCRSFLLLRHHSAAIANDYVAAYARVGVVQVPDVWPWLAVVAAARLAENLADETDELMALADGA